MDISAKLDTVNGHEHPDTKGTKSQLRYQNGEKVKAVMLHQVPYLSARGLQLLMVL